MCAPIGWIRPVSAAPRPCGVALGIEGPPFGNWTALLVVDADLAVGRRAEGEVEHERRFACRRAGRPTAG